MKKILGLLGSIIVVCLAVYLAYFLFPKPGDGYTLQYHR